MPIGRKETSPDTANTTPDQQTPPRTDRSAVIGTVRMSVAFSDPSPEDEARSAERVDALVAWLLAEWHREHDDTD